MNDEITIRSIDFDERIDFIKENFSDIENPYFQKLDKYEKLAVIDDLSFNEDYIGEYNQENNTDRYHTNPLPLSYIHDILDRKNLKNEYSHFNLSDEGRKRHYDEVIREYNKEHLNDFLPLFHNDKEYSYYTVTSREIFDKIKERVEKEKISPFIAVPDYDQILNNIKKTNQKELYKDISKEGLEYTKFYFVIDNEKNKWSILPRQDLKLIGENAKCINDTLNLEVKCNTSGLSSKNYYYSENTKQLCHDVKELGSLNYGKYNPLDYANTLNKMADYIHSQHIIDKNSIIVPAPQHTGKAEYTLDLAEALYNRIDCLIADILKAKPHDTLYEQKKNGKETDLELYLDKEKDFALRAVQRACEEGKKVYFLDNVISTGKTFNEASKLIPGIIPCSYAISDFARIGFDNGKYFVYNRLEGISMNNSLMAENMRLQGDNARWVVIDWDQNKNIALLRKCNYFDEKTDSYVIANNYTLYGDSVNPCITWGHGGYMDNVSEEYANGIFKCRKNDMEVTLSVPEGWRQAVGVTTTPNGFVAITNGNSRWNDPEPRKTMFIWKEYFDRDMKEKQHNEKKDFFLPYGLKTKTGYILGKKENDKEQRFFKINYIQSGEDYYTLDGKKLETQKIFLEDAVKRFRSSIENTPEGKKASVLKKEKLLEELLNKNLTELQKNNIVNSCEESAKKTNINLEKEDKKTKGNKRS